MSLGRPAAMIRGGGDVPPQASSIYIYIYIHIHIYKYVYIYIYIYIFP